MWGYDKVASEDGFDRSQKCFSRVNTAVIVTPLGLFIICYHQKGKVGPFKFYIILTRPIKFNYLLVPIYKEQLFYLRALRIVCVFSMCLMGKFSRMLVFS